MFATYCVFTSIIFYLLFNEKLKVKFLVGIGLMVACVTLVALS
jgi:multidrug transporter EmrE-like cation transporter